MTATGCAISAIPRPLRKEERYWDAERLRVGFHESGLATKM